MVGGKDKNRNSSHLGQGAAGKSNGQANKGGPKKGAQGGGGHRTSKQHTNEPRAESSSNPTQPHRRDGRQQDNQQRSQQEKRPPFISLFADQFKDPESVLERFLKMSDTTTLISELSHGQNLDRFSKYFDWSGDDTVITPVIELVVLVLGRPFFLDATQQDQVNLILETLIASSFFTGSQRLSLINRLYNSKDKFAACLCGLLNALLDRHGHLSLTKLRSLFLHYLPHQPGHMTSEWEALHLKYARMVQLWQDTGEIHENTRKVAQEGRNRQTSRTNAGPQRVEYADDPSKDGPYAIKERSIPTPEELSLIQREFLVRTNPIVNGETFGSVEEYLDTHWRLLRADALEDIRIGIFELLQARELHLQAYMKVVQEHRIRRLPDPPQPAFQYPYSHGYYAYYRVKFFSFAARGNGSANSLNFQISFQIPATSGRAVKKPIDWTRSKRLLPGSLLVLSSDHFKSLVWAVVANRNPKLLDKSMTLINLDSSDLSSFNPDQEFEMLETRAFWTSYSHVLSKLASLMRPDEPFPLQNIIIGQNAGDNHHLFPGTLPLLTVCQRKSNKDAHDLQKYLLLSDDEIRQQLQHRAPRAAQQNAALRAYQAVGHPWDQLYLHSDDDALTRELQQLHLRAAEYQAHQPRLLDDPPTQHQTPKPPINSSTATPSSKPSASGAERFLLPAPADPEDLAHPKHLTLLDRSQWSALKMILTQRVSIVQGPPGTGKTFLGLKAAEILLQQRGFQGPILCVCYTNHALDQFLEGIMEFEPAVVRVGSRSKSEKLQARELFQLMSNERPSSRSIGIAVKQREDARESLSTLFKQLNDRKSIIQGFFSFLQFRPSKNESPEAFIMSILGVNSIHPMKSSVSSSASATAAPIPVEAMEAEEDDEEEILEELNNRADDPDFDDEIDSTDDAEQCAINDAFLETLTEGGSRLDWDMLVNDLQRLGRDQFMKLPLQKRRSYFFTLVDEYRKRIMAQIRTQSTEFSNASKRIQAVDTGFQVDFLRTQRVVGMTTTGAARHATMLKALGASVVIIEEAAEIFEAHTIACLSPRVEKLILIGDHQQLRPKVTYYPLVKRGLDISLFERLVKVGIPHVTLRQQHRMHPEISRYIRPIYPALINGPRTLENRPETLGIGHRVFFVSHNWPEAGGGAEEDISSSKSNEKEAAYIFGLVRYLLAQGQDPSRISVIAMYQGQNNLIRRLLRGNPPKGFPQLYHLQEKLFKVRVCCVDDYQGEENEIIIVSLVRSNRQGEVGFVSIANRVCVALSRARSSMYVLGSETTLRLASSRSPKRRSATDNPQNNQLWPQILDLMTLTDCIGPRLELCCTNHPETKQVMEEPTDWARSLTACTKPCGVQRTCGHVCLSSCHAQLPHPKCVEPCARIFSACGHLCTLACYQDCGQCKTLMKNKFSCGHESQFMCHLLTDPEQRANLRCPARCPRLLSCGHQCPKKCGQPCPDKCLEPVFNISMPCGHIAPSMTCHDSRNPTALAKFPHPCTAKLDCGHTCEGDCVQHRDGSHVCTGKCSRTLPCTHVCKGNCNEPCPPCKQRCTLSCSHTFCKSECNNRCIPCMMKCNWKCKHKRCTTHCSDPCDRDGCDEPCPKTLPCGHECLGLCGEPCPNICRICTPEAMVFSSFSFVEPLKSDDETARYIYLPNCKHSIAVLAMDLWMKTKEEETATVELPKCPQCTAPITQAFGRYANFIKKTVVLLDVIRTKYRKDAIRRKYEEGDFKATKNMIKKLLNQPAMGHSMEAPPRDIDMLLLLAVTLMKLKEDEKHVSDLVDEILRRDPENSDAKAIQDGLLKNIIPKLAQALQGEVQRGAWYMCRNGHPYVIGECGGAMEQAKCPCGAPIGGANHALRADNQHYGAADGSLHPAWGDQANMANYNLEEVPDR